MIANPIFEKRIQNHRLILLVESDDFLLLECILHSSHICRRIETIFLYDFRSTESCDSVKDGKQQTELMVREIVDNRIEARFMD